MSPLGQKNDVGRGLHMIIYYHYNNCMAVQSSSARLVLMRTFLVAITRKDELLLHHIQYKLKMFLLRVAPPPFPSAPALFYY